MSNINNMVYRLIDKSELYHIKTLFSKDARSVKIRLTDSDINAMISRLEQGMDNKTSYVYMTFYPNGSPYAMYVANEIAKAGAWYIGLTKVISSANHFNQSAAIIAPALNNLIQLMEDKGYYKFWMAAPEKHHNLRNMIMRKHSFMLDRYDWFDEVVIPPGEKSNVAAYDSYRRVIDWSSIVVRLFVLKQKYRVEIFRKQGHTDYVGTVLE